MPMAMSATLASAKISAASGSWYCSKNQRVFYGNFPNLYTYSTVGSKYNKPSTPASAKIWQRLLPGHRHTRTMDPKLTFELAMGQKKHASSCLRIKKNPTDATAHRQNFYLLDFWRRWETPAPPIPMLFYVAAGARVWQLGKKVAAPNGLRTLRTTLELGVRGDNRILDMGNYIGREPY